MRNKWTKRAFSLLIAAVLILGMFPASLMAGARDEDFCRGQGNSPNVDPTKCYCSACQCANCGKQVQICLTVIWRDENNKAGLRPSSVTTQFNKGNTNLGSLKLSQANQKAPGSIDWASGVYITCTPGGVNNVVYQEVPNYSVKVGNEDGRNIFITYTYSPSGSPDTPATTPKVPVSGV